MRGKGGASRGAGIVEGITNNVGVIGSFVLWLEWVNHSGDEPWTRIRTQNSASQFCDRFKLNNNYDNNNHNDNNNDNNNSNN